MMLSDAIFTHIIVKTREAWGAACGCRKQRQKAVSKPEPKPSYCLIFYLQLKPQDAVK